MEASLKQKPGIIQYGIVTSTVSILVRHRFKNVFFFYDGGMFSFFLSFFLSFSLTAETTVKINIWISSVISIHFYFIQISVYKCFDSRRQHIS